MGRINTARLLLATLVTGIFFFIADGLVHGGLFAQDYEAAMTRAGYEVKQDPVAYGYFVLFDLGKALVALLVYVYGRARFGPGPKTAIQAGLIAWFAVEALPAIAMMPFPFFGRWFLTKLITIQILPMVLGTILGAWVYREGNSEPAASQ